jgi:hypothetical protein
MDKFQELIKTEYRQEDGKFIEREESQKYATVFSGILEKQRPGKSWKSMGKILP